MKREKRREGSIAGRALLRATWRHRRKKLDAGVSAFFSVPRLRKEANVSRAPTRYFRKRCCMENA